MITYPNQTCKISSSINRGNPNYFSYVFPLFIEQLFFICFCVMNFSFFLFVLYILLHISENIVCHSTSTLESRSYQCRSQNTVCFNTLYGFSHFFIIIHMKLFHHRQRYLHPPMLFLQGFLFSESSAQKS